MVIRELSFHAGEDAEEISDCCAYAPNAKTNETNMTMEANALRRISFSRASRMIVYGYACHPFCTRFSPQRKALVKRICHSAGSEPADRRRGIEAGGRVNHATPIR